MKILVLHTPRNKTPNLESISPRTIRRISTCLTDHGYEVEEASYSPYRVNKIIEKTKPSLVFNLAYGYLGKKMVEEQPDTTLRLENLGQATVGATSDAQRVAQDKLETARVLMNTGIVSPRILDPREGPFPEFVIMKPRNGACHRNIRVVHHSQIDTLLTVPENILLQEFISGPEFTVGVIETPEGIRAISPLIIEYTDETPQPHYMDWNVCRWNYAVDRTDEFHLMPLAIAAFKGLQLRDYARFDFRISKHGPVLLDANSLPNLHPEISLLPLSCSLNGILYPELIGLIVNNAAKRLN